MQWNLQIFIGNHKYESAYIHKKSQTHLGVNKIVHKLVTLFILASALDILNLEQYREHGPLRKDDTQIREVFHIFGGILHLWFKCLVHVLHFCMF